MFPFCTPFLLAADSGSPAKSLSASIIITVKYNPLPLGVSDTSMTVPENTPVGSLVGTIYNTNPSMQLNFTVLTVGSDAAALTAFRVQPCAGNVFVNQVLRVAQVFSPCAWLCFSMPSCVLNFRPTRLSRAMSRSTSRSLSQFVLNYEARTSYTIAMNVTGEVAKVVYAYITVTNVRRGLILMTVHFPPSRGAFHPCSAPAATTHFLCPMCRSMSRRCLPLP
jgi:hypothetical protein